MIWRVPLGQIGSIPLYKWNFGNLTINKEEEKEWDNTTLKGATRTQ